MAAAAVLALLFLCVFELALMSAKVTLVGLVLIPEALALDLGRGCAVEVSIIVAVVVIVGKGVVVSLSVGGGRRYDVYPGAAVGYFCRSWSNSARSLGQYMMGGRLVELLGEMIENTWL